MVKKNEADALNLIGLLYDTALNGQGWVDALNQITGSIDAKSAMLRMVDYTKSQVGSFDAVGIDTAYREAYSRHYVNIDIYRGFFETAPIGMVVAGSGVPGYGSRHDTEFFNDYQKPQDMEYICGSVLVRNDDLTIQFGAHRSRLTRDFGQDDLDFLQKVLPHLVRAVQIRQSLAVQSNRQVLAETALDQLHLGVLLVDAQTRPVFINHMAEHYIAVSNNALKLSPDGLRITKQNDTAMLRRLVAEAACTTAGEGFGSGGEMRITCGDGSYLQLSVAPLSRQCLDSGFAAPSACAMIFIARPGSIQLPWRRVAVCYGLTPAEAKLAVQLTSGESLEEVAETLGITIHTARTHLKMIFAKTGVRRQSGLVAMLLQGVLAWRGTIEDDVTVLLSNNQENAG